MRLRYLLIPAAWLVCGGFIWMTVTGRLAPSPESLLRRASVDESRHQLDAAERSLRRAVAVKPDYAAAHLELSRLLLRRNAFVEAFGSLHAALEADPLIILSHNFDLYLQAVADADTHKAYLKTFSSLAADVPPQHARPEHLGALELAAHLRIRRLQAALHQAAAGLAELAGDAGEAVIDHVLAGEYAAATEQLAPMKQTSEVAAELIELIGRARTERDAAQQTLETVLAKKPGFTAARLGLAVLHKESGREHKGLQLLLEIVDDLQRPSNELLIFAARELAAQGRLLEAEPLVDRVLEAQPGNVPARHLQAAILFTRGRVDKLEPMARRYCENNPSDPHMTFLLGAAELTLGKYHLAVHHLSEASGDFPVWEPLLYYAGLAHYRAGNLNQADEHLSRLCNRPGGFPEARIALASLRLSEERPADAAKLCREVLDEQPDDPDALRLLAAACLDQCDAAGARAALGRLLALQPHNAAAAEALGGVRLSQGELEQVIDDYEARIADSGGTPADHRVLAFAHSLAGNLDRAGRHYARLQDNDPSRAEPWLFRARLLALDGRTREAAEECRAALRSRASSRAVLPVLGVLNTILGRYYEARENLAWEASPLAQGTLVANVYLALAPREDPPADAARILLADPFSFRSQTLLVDVSAAHLAKDNLRQSLDAMIDANPAMRGVLNKVILLRRREAATQARTGMISLDTLWPRLLAVYQARPIFWP